MCNTFIHYRTIKMDVLIIACLRPWCEFSSEVFFLSKFLQFLFLLGEIFSGNSKNFLGPMWSDTISTPGYNISQSKGFVDGKSLFCTAQQLDSVAELVRALHRNRRAAGSIPARDLYYYTYIFRSCSPGLRLPLD